MCSAIAAVMLQGTFDHIHNPENASVKDTSNKFYESWVNKIDIEYLLQSSDLNGDKPLVSLLDSSIIEQIANYALTPGPATARPYISDALTLFLTLTDVRGIPYALTNAPGSAEEVIAYYADRIQFETVENANAPTSPSARPLPKGSNGGDWPLLKQAAMATGAFPLFLAPRTLDRTASEYQFSPWLSLTDVNAPATPPDWPLKPTDAFETLNVDGGVTNNDPFQLAHDFLAIHNPTATRDEKTGELRNPREADTANCAVLTVAPFPASCAYDKDFIENNSDLLSMIPNLITVLISQSRFLGESLSAGMGGPSHSRFVLAPSDADNPSQDALQCGVLGAFGGFFERGFRAHDYQLGRRNCQKFLRDYFRLALNNPVVDAPLRKLGDSKRAAIIRQFDPANTGTIQIIPLCGSAVPEVPAPVRAKITQARLNNILNWATDRLHIVAGRLVKSILGSGVESAAAKLTLDGVISTIVKAKLKDYLQKELADVISH